MNVKFALVNQQLHRVDYFTYMPENWLLHFFGKLVPSERGLSVIITGNKGTTSRSSQKLVIFSSHLMMCLYWQCSNYRSKFGPAGRGILSKTSYTESFHVHHPKFFSDTLIEECMTFLCWSNQSHGNPFTKKGTGQNCLKTWFMLCYQKVGILTAGDGKESICFLRASPATFP